MTTTETRGAADPTAAFIHRFEPAGDPGRPPILLLHGTGGDEADLLPLGRAVAPGSALLSPRGRVSEHDMPRFFRRLSEGVFDEADVVRRAAELADFVAAARERYGIAAPIALGFSNGANIAAAVMLLHPGVLAGGVLIRAMPPLSAAPARPADGSAALVLSGAMDPIVTAAQAARLAADLTAAGVAVEHRTLPASHGLTQSDVNLAHGFIAAR